MPKQAVTDQEIIDCFDVMSELRTHLVKDHFLSTIRSMEIEGYRLAFIKNQGAIAAVAGYRISTNLFMGKHLYVDDLVTSRSARSKGFGETLVKWLRDIAKNNSCNFYHLDSGTHRDQAHKFYFKQGFIIASYHFSEQLK
ncbi:MAG: GNAT family N-acetyltransferase [Gammaproteobacteria bacterium]|nr:GNAT family N-acetyltransferase [Gammaproteobacteria bacterium]